MILIAAYQGKSFISRLIRWQTRSKYSHIGILFTHDCTIKAPLQFGHAKEIVITSGNVIEAWEGGVRLSRSISEVHEPGTPVDIFCFKDPLTEEEQSLAARFLCAQIGKPYDYKSIIRFLTREPINRWRRTKWFCSELGFEAFLVAGRELLARCAAWEIPPRDIPRSPLLKFLKSMVTQ